ncbi:hypothetical protein FRB90_010425 [Tulasnella sp. 427]|nr:hypothetical protein FRB90_010425 [Tulasnella sp. 427]
MMYTPSSPEVSEEEVMEEEFDALPRSLKRKIDDAFDRAVREAQGPGSKGAERKARSSKDTDRTKGRNIAGSSKKDDLGGGFLPPEDDDMGGGFIPMDTDEDGGGFLPTDKKESEAEDPTEHPTHIPLSLIPRALQILDLPQDIDILTIFENAASGWGGQSVAEEEAVSRKDWRAVCAVLFENPQDAGVKEDSLSPPPPSDGEREREKDSADDMEEDDEDDEDVYAQSDDSDEDAEDADSDYGARATGMGKTPKRATRSQRKSKDASLDEDGSSSGIITLTHRQRKECKIAFALFFPDVEEKELADQRLKIKEVADAFKILKERMTTEEIVEMLEYFSTAPDKSMSLSDFEQMCMRTGLV